MLKSITEAPISLGDRVLVRGNLNVPIEHGVIADTSRVLGNLPTLRFLKSKGAKVILIGHLSVEGESLKTVAGVLAQHIPVSFLTNPFNSEGKEVLKKMADGDIVCIENIRQFPEEEKNDVDFAKKLAGLADMFVNDDFTSAHRAHASVVGVPKLIPSYMGLEFAEEYTHLSQAFNPQHPSVLIVGGAKPETKLPLITALAPHMDTVFVFGVSGNSLLRAKGFSVGKSLVAVSSDESLQTILAMPNISAYRDVLTIDTGGKEHVLKPEAIGPDDTIVDAGPETLAHLSQVVSGASFVLWNGPLGLYEKGFSVGTQECARAIASSHAESIVGGGDTDAVLAEGHITGHFSFISSAGGAMLEFLAKGTLPGIEALK
ncbi:MAG: phosphoglycerate kinase [Candidatus Campbellbacteria bacterium]|nr:phosphoglycerate kinase [Candidatus Campbellbacteria bacterium]